MDRLREECHLLYNGSVKVQFLCHSKEMVLQIMLVLIFLLCSSQRLVTLFSSRWNDKTSYLISICEISCKGLLLKGQ